MMPGLEQTICERAANALVEQDKHEGDIVAFVGQPVGVPFAMAFDEAMATGSDRGSHGGIGALTPL